VPAVTAAVSVRVPDAGASVAGSGAAAVQAHKTQRSAAITVKIIFSFVSFMLSLTGPYPSTPFVCANHAVFNRFARIIPSRLINVYHNYSSIM
jgi:hypothetical protein